MLQQKAFACCNFTAHDPLALYLHLLYRRNPMPPLNAKRCGSQKATSPPSPTPKPQADDLVLHGNIESLKFVFVTSQRRLISTSVPDSILSRLQAYPGGVSSFFEDAVAAFDGDLRALVEAAVLFVENRRYQTPEDPARNASGRVLPATFEKIQKIHAALVAIRGMSRAKVLAGLIQLKLSKNIQ